MLIKDLIKELQIIYDQEMENEEILGSPEIMIDSFEKIDAISGAYKYAGFDKTICIERSPDGVYLIFNRFKNDSTTNT